MIRWSRSKHRDANALWYNERIQCYTCIHGVIKFLQFWSERYWIFKKIYISLSDTLEVWKYRYTKMFVLLVFWREVIICQCLWNYLFMKKLKWRLSIFSTFRSESLTTLWCVTRLYRANKTLFTVRKEFIKLHNNYLCVVLLYVW